MEILKSPDDVIEAVRRLDGRIGLAATMGALHEGHIAIIKAAKLESDYLVASLFVNPSQFGALEDFDSYPRPVARDMEILEREGVDLVWAPTVEDVYPDSFSTQVDPGPISRSLEGISRPGHLNGVATVVSKIFNIVHPDITVFGQKDWQQTRVIDKLIQDLNFDVQMLVIPTVRTGEGLAISSRNALLTDDKLDAARILYASLDASAEMYYAGERDAASLRAECQSVLSTEPLCQQDYVSVAHALTLDELEQAAEPMVICCAASFGSVRLIDNMVFGIDLYRADSSP